MSYNWKCCSFYPNNFDASALTRPRSDVTHAKQSVCLCSIASGTCADMCCYVLLLVLLNVLFLDLQIFQYV